MAHGRNGERDSDKQRDCEGHPCQPATRRRCYNRGRRRRGRLERALQREAHVTDVADALF
jgi:hypothetical protein